MGSKEGEDGRQREESARHAHKHARTHAHPPTHARSHAHARTPTHTRTPTGTPPPPHTHTPTPSRNTQVTTDEALAASVAAELAARSTDELFRSMALASAGRVVAQVGALPARNHHTLTHKHTAQVGALPFMAFSLAFWEWGGGRWAVMCGGGGGGGAYCLFHSLPLAWVGAAALFTLHVGRGRGPGSCAGWWSVWAVHFFHRGLLAGTGGRGQGCGPSGSLCSRWPCGPTLCHMRTGLLHYPPSQTRIARCCRGLKEVFSRVHFHVHSHSQVLWRLGGICPVVCVLSSICSKRGCEPPHTLPP